MNRGDKAKSSLTFLTYNLWHGLDPKSNLRFREYETPEQREERLLGFYAQVRELNPDIVFLQEVNPAPGLTARIAKNLGFDSTQLIDNAGLKIGSLGIPTNLRSGLAILARKGLRLKGLGGRKLSGPFGFTSRALCIQLAEFRYVLAARIMAGGKPILLLNTHLHHGPEITPATRAATDGLVGRKVISRQRADEILAVIDGASARRRGELEKALAFAKDLGFEDGAVVFAGDFNASPDAPELVWMKTGQGFASATSDDDPQKRLMTWDWERNPNTHFIESFTPVDAFGDAEVDRALQNLEVGLSRRIDYIFYRNLDFLALENSGLFGDKPRNGRMSSDHFGLFAKFFFR